MDLLFVAKCKEEDIYQVRRDLNREMKLMFNANRVNVPFPQIVLNQPTVFEPEKGQVADVREFLDEQRKLSKGVEEKAD